MVRQDSNNLKRPISHPNSRASASSPFALYRDILAASLVETGSRADSLTKVPATGFHLTRRRSSAEDLYVRPFMHSHRVKARGQLPQQNGASREHIANTTSNHGCKRDCETRIHNHEKRDVNQCIARRRMSNCDR